MPQSFAVATTPAGQDIQFLPAMANRHGLVTGATGTGKTVTLQLLTDRFSSIGVPVFLADVKRDLSGVAAAGSLTPKLAERLKTIHANPPEWRANAAVFWDVFGRRGFPVRATVSDFGPLLLGRQRGLNATQECVLARVFKIADDSGLLLLDLKNLRAMLQFVGDDSCQFTTQYGNVSAASDRRDPSGVARDRAAGWQSILGEPMLDINDLLQTDGKGRGMVNVLSAEELIRAPKLYSTFLLWMLSELFERLPVGDPGKTIDRESAYEKVKARTLSKEIPAAPGTTPADPGTQPTGFRDVVSNILFGTTGPRGAHHDGLVDAAAKSAARSFGSAVSRSIVRGALGSILGGSSRGRR